MTENCATTCSVVMAFDNGGIATATLSEDATQLDFDNGATWRKKSTQPGSGVNGSWVDGPNTNTLYGINWSGQCSAFTGEVINDADVWGWNTATFVASGNCTAMGPNP